MKSIKQSVDEVRQLIQLGIDKIDADKADNAVVVIGKSGHGKSTLINYLSQTSLRAVKPGILTKIVIEAETPGGAIKIVSGASSGTDVPGKFYDATSGITYFDCPGFGDTRGIVQDIANSFYIKKVFDVIQKVKIVMVVSADSLEERATDLIRIIKDITNLFPNTSQLKESSTLVISKADLLYTADIVKQVLVGIFNTQSQGLSPQQKIFLNHFTSPEAKIAIFHRPEKIGAINPEAAELILDKIQSVEYIKKPEVNISVSLESQYIADEWSSIVAESICSSLQKTADLLEKYYRDSLTKNIDLSATSEIVSKSIESLKKSANNPAIAAKLAEDVLQKHGIKDQALIDQISNDLDYLGFIKKIGAKLDEQKIINKYDEMFNVFTFASLQIQNKQAEINQKELEYQNNDLRNHQQNLESRNNDLQNHQRHLAEQQEQLKRENEELKNRTPVVHNHYHNKKTFCSIFMVDKIKFDNPFLNLPFQQQKALAAKFAFSLSQMVDLTSRTSDFMWENLLLSELAGENTDDQY